MRRNGGSVFPARGLSGNENACALISMMARSKCSNLRPDTLMQDRSPPTRRNHLQRTAGPYIWVKAGNTRCEYLFSALLLKERTWSGASYGQPKFHNFCAGPDCAHSRRRILAPFRRRKFSHNLRGPHLGPPERANFGPGPGVAPLLNLGQALLQALKLQTNLRLHGGL